MFLLIHGDVSLATFEDGVRIINLNDGLRFLPESSLVYFHTSNF